MPNRIEINGDLAAGTGQPDRSALATIARDGFAAIFGLRAAGEAVQTLPPGSERAEADRLGLRYADVLVPNDSVTAEHLDRLSAEVAHLPKPVFLHGASGRRTGSFAMIEAARREEPSGEDMLRRAESLGVPPSSEPVRATYRT